MSRNVCSQCHRPQKTCICEFIQPIDNYIEIGILQHPTEVKQTKGTAIIANLALNRSQIWVGELISELPGLVDWLNDDNPIYLLYPKIDNQSENYQSWSIDDVKVKTPQHIKILILDGTWRKTFKMMQLNPELRALPRIELKPEFESQYKVRKQKDSGSLSTVEAVYELLSQLENDAEKFQPLLDAFNKMQQQQLAFSKKSE